MVLLQITEAAGQVYDTINKIKDGRDFLVLLTTALAIALYFAMKKIWKLEAADKGRLEKENADLKQRIEILQARDESNSKKV